MTTNKRIAFHVDGGSESGQLICLGRVFDLTTKTPVLWTACECGRLRLTVPNRWRRGFVKSCSTCSGYNQRFSAETLSADPLLKGKYEHRVQRSTCGGCWDWTGSTDSDGYPKVYIYGHSLGAHRVSWLLHRGGIPKGLHVLHECDNPRCTNPDHLFIGTHRDNMRDLFRKQADLRDQGRRYTSRLKKPLKQAA